MAGVRHVSRSMPRNFFAILSGHRKSSDSSFATARYLYRLYNSPFLFHTYGAITHLCFIVMSLSKPSPISSSSDTGVIEITFVDHRCFAGYMKTTLYSGAYFMIPDSNNRLGFSYVKPVRYILTGGENCLHFNTESQFREAVIPKPHSKNVVDYGPLRFSLPCRTFFSVLLRY